jgi:citrate synthase
VLDPNVRQLQIKRLIGKMPTIAAYTYRHSLGYPYVYPDNDLSYTENFMNMLWKMVEPKYQANPVLARALDILFILHADHEQNCSTNAMRAVGSSQADPFLSTAAACAPRSPARCTAAPTKKCSRCSTRSAPRTSPGLHRQGQGRQRQADGLRPPRLQELRSARPHHQVGRRQVFEVTGRNPKLDIALELERIALEDEYFVKRKLYPNVDFYSGIIYQAMGFKPEMFTVLFAIPRTVGWLAQWQEMLCDPEQKIARPRQIIPATKRASRSRSSTIRRLCWHSGHTRCRQMIPRRPPR